ncbi:LysM peptidoglycan-binding domain-containing protein [Pseudonocardia nigra]|uniref:LysM peptidoglycan-binding domain-containing protein n=1 Tax=Pseudonocardia nigra TaxID=1921578 RepID=UPI001C5E329D|nr:LysM domain-containing protein [Pseudonocardia nigra]
MRAIRVAVSAAMLVAIVGGVPVALWVTAGEILPATWPEWQDVLAMLGRPDDGRLLLGFLYIVGVVAWAQLTLSIVAEFVGVLARRPALRIELPGFRISRTFAALLVGSLLSAGSASAWAAPVSPTAVAAPLAPGPGIGPKGQVEPEGPVYEVAARDTLWRIAERELGDPLRWREIFDLNTGRVQADGGRLTEAGLLHVGWRLVLPADAAVTNATGEVTVVPGDTLSEIAAAELATRHGPPNSSRSTEAAHNLTGRSWSNRTSSGRAGR